MTVSLFFDTNVFVYAYDTNEPDKQQKAQELIKKYTMQECATISSQVLSEFFNVVTRKIPEPLTAREAQEIISNLSILNVVDIDFGLVNRAIDNCKYHISYWDSLIVAAAERASCEKILSEDMNSGQEYNGIVVVNPFLDW